MEFITADLLRRFENMIRIGMIADIDYKNKKARVKIGGLITDWLLWPAAIGYNVIHWQPPAIGTQVILACISGDLAQAIIIATLYNDQFNSPSDNKNIDLIQFKDGTQISYDNSSQSLTISAIGNITISSLGDFRVIAKNIELG